MALVRCIFGPRLFRIHKNETERGRNYAPNGVEHGSDLVIKWLRFCLGLCRWTSPVLLVMMYRRNWFSMDGLASMSRMAAGLLILIVGSTLFRGIGRFTNTDYITFIAVLQAARKSLTPENMRLLRRYDFEFWAWPVNFSWKEGSRGDGSKPLIQLPGTAKSRGIVSLIKFLPCNIVSYVVAHTFGRRMMYPGATSLMNTLVFSPILEARSKLIEKNGLRAKVETPDGNHIDTMFIDRRDSFEMSNGKYLVVCSEGNAGFYEIGCMVTPMDAGYSVLGWNHPGFSGSTGAPFPEQEQNAVDTVMQYAITRLGFKPEEIILFAWSIGGFPASFAAMNYPDVKAVILDATFDDVMPLAVARMPQSWRGLVSMTVRRYLNIPISSQLCQYPGPVLLIRRTNDEMITTVDQTVIGSNRGNDLLIKLLQYRYPNIVNSDTEVLLRNWLECKNTEDKLQFLTNHGVDDDMCEATFASFVMENSLSFPMQIGEGISEDLRSQLALFLAYKHMEDFESTHCTPLPTTHFKLPWQPKLVTARNFDDVD